MSNDSSLRRQLPHGAFVTTKLNADGDRVPTAVSYPTESGGKKTVSVKLTADGDYIPETGHTIDGDHNYPGKRLDY